MLSLRQDDLQNWQHRNFRDSLSADMIIGMAEELGELSHWYLKRKQGIREGVKGGDFKAEIGDTFADVVIYGIQLMTNEGIDAEQVIKDTIIKVLKRNWKDNPSGAGET